MGEIFDTVGSNAEIDEPLNIIFIQDLVDRKIKEQKKLVPFLIIYFLLGIFNIPLIENQNREDITRLIFFNSI